MIPPFVQQVIGVLVRAAVVFIAGWLAAHGGPSFTEDQIGKVVTEIVPIAAVLTWSIYMKYRAKQKQLVAQAAGHPVSENHVEMLVSAGQAPSVFTPKHEAPVLVNPTQKEKP